MSISVGGLVGLLSHVVSFHGFNTSCEKIWFQFEFSLIFWGVIQYNAIKQYNRMYVGSEALPLA